MKDIQRGLFSNRVLWDSLQICIQGGSNSDIMGCMGVAAETGANWAIELLAPNILDTSYLDLVALHAEKRGHHSTAKLIRDVAAHRVPKSAVDPPIRQLEHSVPFVRPLV